MASFRASKEGVDCFWKILQKKLLTDFSHLWGFLSGSVVKNPPAMQETRI